MGRGQRKRDLFEPAFYDEFSDPDMIRVGDDYYLTGTTMHTMPGLPILHSRDLVNWQIVGYAFDRLDLGPDLRLEDGKNIYGGGIWAPCFRYHNGTFYIFANVNRYGLQVFRPKILRGPWEHNASMPGLHDLSVLFDDDGKIYVSLRVRRHPHRGTQPGTDGASSRNRSRSDSTRAQGMGEGSHFYKINGKYYIVSAIPGAHVPMKCARADKLDGAVGSGDHQRRESFGIGQGYRPKRAAAGQPPFKNNPPDLSQRLDLDMHQGGIIETQKGDWWGFSMHGPQLGGPADVAFAGDVGERLAVFRPAGKSDAHACRSG